MSQPYTSFYNDDDAEKCVDERGTDTQCAETKCDQLSNASNEDQNIKPDLEVLTNGNKDVQSHTLKTVSVVPGKGPPPEPPITCCMSGCANCVWIDYADELKAYYNDGGEKAMKAVENIEDPSLKAFIKLELSLK